MAKPRASVGSVPLRPKSGLRALFRLGFWGLGAAFALFVALSAATTEIGRDRLHQAVAEIREIVRPSGVKPIRPLDAREGRRLAETVRELTVDREALHTRVATLEQGLGGITGSIARIEKATTETAWLTAPNLASAEAVPAAAAPENVASSIHPLSATPLPPPSPGFHAAKVEFGLDLGNASSIEALRTAWTAALRRHSALLLGLRPVVQTRERGRAGAVELRLVAGPLANAATAARLCAAMTAAGAVCAPATFEGRRLAVR